MWLCVGLDPPRRLGRTLYWQPLKWESETNMIKKVVGSHLFYPSHLPLLLIGILLSFLACLVKAAYKTFDVAFMSKAILVMLP